MVAESPEARKRFGLSVLNYIATSNHVHLLVRDTGDHVIPRSMQLLAGRVAQEYNQRKSRKGAFWEDRYFATAVATDRHLIQCLVYIDLNMVRADAVLHPSQWVVSGYREIQRPPERYRIIDFGALCQLTSSSDRNELQLRHGRWVEENLSRGHLFREPKWTVQRAVGPDDFVEAMANRSNPMRQQDR